MRGEKFDTPVVVHLGKVTSGAKPGVFHVEGELEAPEVSAETGFEKAKLSGKIKRGKLTLKLVETSNSMTDYRFVLKLAEENPKSLSGKANGRSMGVYAPEN